jgi:hypothetical protein
MSLAQQANDYQDERVSFANNHPFDIANYFVGEFLYIEHKYSFEKNLGVVFKKNGETIFLNTTV